MNFEIIIKQVREEKGISLRELAEETGIDRHRLSNIEDGIVEINEVLFIEMLVIANELEKTVLDLYKVKNIEIS